MKAVKRSVHAIADHNLCVVRLGEIFHFVDCKIHIMKRLPYLSIVQYVGIVPRKTAIDMTPDRTEIKPALSPTP